MANGAFDYVKNVLGISGFIAPEGSALPPLAQPATERPGEARGAANEVPATGILVQVPKKPTQAETEFLTKMLLAVAISNFRLEVTDVEGLEISDSTGVAAKVQLPPLAEFLGDPKSATVLDLKKRAWEALKNFKKQVDKKQQG